MSTSSVSVDTFFDGRLICRQHLNGYRFSVDAVLLAHFISPQPGNIILDLGAGCGIISLILAHRHSFVSLSALEYQPALHELLCRNIAENRFEDRIRPLRGDLCHIDQSLAAETFDIVLCNPPYRKSGSGRVNPGGEAAIARHEVCARLSDVVNAMAFAVKNRGRIALIYPATRGTELFAQLKKRRLEPKRLQVVYSIAGSSGKLLLVEAVKNGGEGLKVLPPFYIYRDRKGRNYTEEMAALYRP